LEREGVVGRELVGEDDSSILVCWRNLQHIGMLYKIT
jgi:hypothetical protein